MTAIDRVGHVRLADHTEDRVKPPGEDRFVETVPGTGTDKYAKKTLHEQLLG